jgi:serine/tyrosine/threonine adenylyltransferase
MTAQIEAVDFFAFDNSYARLPDRFFARLRPTPVAEPRLVRLNKELAWHLRLDPGKLAASEGVEILAGNRVPKRGVPLAMAYAGHQFGTFVPQLGDGRAILLGEVIDRDGVRRDIQLKGSGPTPFSRRGDGRAALGPVLREYIVSEAIGILTTRALAAPAAASYASRGVAFVGDVWSVRSKVKVPRLCSYLCFSSSPLSSVTGASRARGPASRRTSRRSTKGAG